VVNALKKAGINPNLVDSDDHIASNISKGYITAEEGEKAKAIRAEVVPQATAALKQAMIENIAKGRVQKFLKDNCLVDQEFQFGDGDKLSVAAWLKSQDKELEVVAYRRFTLVSE
jgi:elongation factor Ts